MCRPPITIGSTVFNTQDQNKGLIKYNKYRELNWIESKCSWSIKRCCMGTKRTEIQSEWQMK